MKKILITSTDVMMAQFLIPHIEYLVECGYKVDVACSKVQGFEGEVSNRLKGIASVSFVKLERSPFSITNICGLRQLKYLIHKGNYDLIWTNEPVMGTMTRIAAIGTKCKVLYFAHGFHFFNGASKKRWLLIYPIEKVLAHFTKVIVTINEEDFQRAKKCFTKKVRIYKIPGIGIDTKKFKKKGIDVVKKRSEFEIGSEDVVLLSVGELEERKNHELTIKAFEKLNIKNAYLLICGKGTQEEKLHELILQSGTKDRIKMLGYRTDISELCEMSDLFVFSTYQEGLSVALMEAMSNELVCVVSRIRGNVDLISKERGFLFDPYSIDECCNAISDALKHRTTWSKLAIMNKEYIRQFDICNVKEQMKAIIDKMLEVNR